MKAELTAMPSGHLFIWDHPVNNRRYVIGADIAEGRVQDKTLSARRKLYSYSDQRPDYSAAYVIELETGLHVATWHGYVSPHYFANTLAAIGVYYNTALIVPEVNGPGIATITALVETIRYPSVYRSRQYAVLERNDPSLNYGWRTLPTNRQILMWRIHEALAERKLFTRDKDLISEIRTMQIDDNGTPRARGGDKDDRVFAMALALQGRYDALGGNQESMMLSSPKDRDTDRAWKHAKEAIQRRFHARTRSSADRRFGPRIPRAGG